MLFTYFAADDGHDIYDMLQTMPKDENGQINKANGLSYEDFKTWLAAKQKESSSIKDLENGYREGACFSRGF